MPMTPHPTSFGVFKPVGHVLLSFATAQASSDAQQALLAAGFGRDAIATYTPQEMLAQTEQDIAQATAMASLGQELNLVKAHRALARQGQSFVAVQAEETEQVQAVTDVALRCKATRAQRYGALVTEELVPPGFTQQQVAESPDRGLDAQTPSGYEATARDAATDA